MYEGDFDVARKADASPLTEADLAAHRCILAGLTRLTPSIPVLSEESAHTVALEQRRGWHRLWLVDPLDGTREFVKRNGEFTVNIALIDDGVPVFGVIQAPVTGVPGAARPGRARSAATPTANTRCTCARRRPRRCAWPRAARTSIRARRC